MKNLLLEIWQASPQGADRHRLTKQYAWAIPSDEALDLIASLGPVLELGAGTGYWAALLADRGVEVVAYDLFPPTVDDMNGWHDKAGTFFHVRQGGAEKASEHADCTLFLCWPPASPTRMCIGCEPPDPENWTRLEKDGTTVWHKPGVETHLAYEALTNYEKAGGSTLVYVGEPPGGVTGGDLFFGHLEDGWEVEQIVDIPCWPGLNDRMVVYRRRRDDA
jgi:hypothetical protein